ncbi:hypothetical protein C6P40_004339, partial [Pichia californica]
NFDTITNNLHEHIPKLYFLDAPAGSGKTFLLNLVINYFNFISMKKIISVASTGIALLMNNSQTAHKVFNIPVKSITSGIDG